MIVSDPERSCSSNKPVGGADNKQTDVVRNKPEKTAYISRRRATTGFTKRSGEEP